MASTSISLGEVLNALTLFNDNLDLLMRISVIMITKITSMVILVEESCAVQS